MAYLKLLTVLEFAYGGVCDKLRRNSVKIVHSPFKIETGYVSSGSVERHQYGRVPHL
jgi:hypothetical protein